MTFIHSYLASYNKCTYNSAINRFNQDYVIICDSFITDSNTIIDV